MAALNNGKNIGKGSPPVEHSFRAGNAGRPRGSKNKLPAAIKDAILEAAEASGGEGRLVEFLKVQAEKNPVAFMGLLGKVLPLQVSGEGGGPIATVTVIERRIIPVTLMSAVDRG